MDSGLQPGRIHALPVQVFYTLPNCSETYTTTLPGLTDVFLHHPSRKRRRLGGTGSLTQLNGSGNGDPSRDGRSIGSGGVGSSDGGGGTEIVGWEGAVGESMVGSVSLRNIMVGVCQASPEIYPSASIPDSTIYIPVIQSVPPSSSKPTPATVQQHHQQPYPTHPHQPYAAYPGWAQAPGAYPYYPPPQGMPQMGHHPQSGPATSPTPAHPSTNGHASGSTGKTTGRKHAQQPQQQQTQHAAPSGGYPYPALPAMGTPNSHPHAYPPWSQYPSYPTPPYPNHMSSIPPVPPAAPSSPSAQAAPQEGKGLLSWILAESIPGNTLAKGKIVRSSVFRTSSGAGPEVGPTEGGLEALVLAAQDRRKRKRGDARNDSAWASEDDSDGEEAGAWGLEISVVLKAMPLGFGTDIKQELPAGGPIDLSRGPSLPRSTAGVERRPSLPPQARPPPVGSLDGLPGSDPNTTSDLTTRPNRQAPPANQRDRARSTAGGLGSVPAARKLSSQLSLVADNARATGRRSKSPVPPLVTHPLEQTAAGPSGTRNTSQLSQILSGPASKASGARQTDPPVHTEPRPPEPHTVPAAPVQSTSGPARAGPSTTAGFVAAPPITVPSSVASAQSHTTPEKKTSHIPAHILKTPSGKNIVAQLRTSPAASMSIARSILKNGPTMLTIELAQKLVTADDFGSILEEMGIQVPDKTRRVGDADAGNKSKQPAVVPAVTPSLLAGVDATKAKPSNSKGKRVKLGESSTGPSPPAASGSTGSVSKPVYTCNNCGTNQSITWRVKALANGGEKRVCDDCGLYFNQTKKMRPKELWNTVTMRTPPAEADAKSDSQQKADPRMTPPPSDNRSARLATDSAFQTPRRSSRLNAGFTPAKPKSNSGSGPAADNSHESPKRVKNTPRRLGKTTSSSNADPASTSRAQKQMMSLSVENAAGDGHFSGLPSQVDQVEMDEQFRLMVESFQSAPAEGLPPAHTANEPGAAESNPPVMSNKELEEFLSSLESGQSQDSLAMAQNHQPDFSQQEMELLLALTQTGGIDGLDLYTFNEDEAAPANRPIEKVVANSHGDWEGSSPWEVDTPTLGGMSSLMNGGVPMLGGGAGPSMGKMQGMSPFLHGMDNPGEIGLAELEHFS